MIAAGATVPAAYLTQDDNGAPEMQVTILESFEYAVNKLTTRRLPKGWTGDLDEATARAAIKAKKAKALVEDKAETKGKGRDKGDNE